MKTRFISIINVILFALLSLFITSCCNGPSDIINISIIKAKDLPPEVNPGVEPQYKVIVKIEFGVDIDNSNLTAPGNINVTAKGSSDREDPKMSGTIQYVASTKTAYFISTNSLSFSPYANENIKYTVIVVGTGDNCVKRQSGGCIDGCDNDTAPGDSYVKEITIIG